jgi:cytochrome oxidase Cu insertion factor (SCO1/SenC/PrrC family)
MTQSDWKRRAVLLATLGALGGVSLGVAGPAAAQKVGEAAPVFSAPATIGTEFKSSDYLGKKWLVVFFYIGAFTKA